MRRDEDIVHRGERRRVNGALVIITALLMVVGLLTLYSAAGSPLRPGPPRAFVMQAIYMAIGTVGLVVAAWIDLRQFDRFAYMLWGAVVVMLVLVLLFGPVRGGSQRWLPLGPLGNLQPSELAKLALVLGFARWFGERPSPGGYGLRDLVAPAVLLLGPLAALVFLEPDLGTTLFLGFIFAGLSFVVGLRWKVVAALALLAALSAPLAYRFVLDDYQKERVDVLLDPDADPKGKGYQAIQGRWAIGSGRWLGKGWRNSTQGRLRFLPEQHTDFIFSVHAEEQGLVGAVFVLGLYFGLMWAGIGVAMRAQDRFGALLAAGVVTVLFCHVVINLGGVLGVLPITGVTLPLMSYGGSSVITILTAIGMLMAVSRQRGAA